MTSTGGANGQGNIFSINTDGSSYTDLHDFTGTDVGEPQGDLTLLGGNLYGMTRQGGANGDGVLFSISTGGSGYKVLYNFGSTGTAGVYPNGSLTLSGSTFYGTTSEGGTDNGNIFSINTDGTGYTDLYDLYR